jgi:3D (Asp-Asp-Asp) domain-containing protein
LVKHRHGVPGEVRRIYRVYFANGRPVKRRFVRTERTEAVDALILMGRAGFATSRGAYTRRSVRIMEATAYDPSAGRGRAATFRTATGLRAQFGVVAVDPRVIPLGTRLFIEGYGYAIAADTGGAIRGNRIDLCKPTRAAALRFGRRMVRVHILRPAR